MHTPRLCRYTMLYHPHRLQERGVALTTSLILVAVLTLLGAAAIVTGVIDSKIGGNYKTSVQAFYAAETGIEEARARLRVNTGADYIDDTSANPQWKAYIASGASPQAAARQQAVAFGYNATNHALYYSRQAALDYTVIIERVTGAPSQLRITSHGSTSSANKTLQIVGVKPPPFAVPAALYVEAPTRVQGATTEIVGVDSCGNDHKRGVVTTLLSIQDGQETVRRLGLPSPTIMGSPDDIQYEGNNLDVRSMVHTFREYANFTYTVSNATHTHDTTPGPGDNWGQPTLGATPSEASTCEAYNVIHYDTGGTSIQLHDGVSGCGLLLVEGDLQIHRGFSWYGLILVTGTVHFGTPELQQKQIRGAVLSGGTNGENRLGLDSHIVYCSTAVNSRKLPLRVLSWKDVYDAP